MTEFVTKKLGEVLAFALLGKETFEKGRAGFLQVFTPDELYAAIEDNNALAEEVRIFAEDNNVIAEAEAKAKITEEKVRRMRDEYIGENWDNGTELLEWSGFFAGAATVHFSLIMREGLETKNDELAKLGARGSKYYRNLLDKVSSAI